MRTSLAGSATSSRWAMWGGGWNVVYCLLFECSEHRGWWAGQTPLTFALAPARIDKWAVASVTPWTTCKTVSNIRLLCHIAAYFWRKETVWVPLQFTLCPSGNRYYGNEDQNKAWYGISRLQVFVFIIKWSCTAPIGLGTRCRGRACLTLLCDARCLLEMPIERLLGPNSISSAYVSVTKVPFGTATTQWRPHEPAAVRNTTPGGAQFPAGGTWQVKGWSGVGAGGGLPNQILTTVGWPDMEALKPGKIASAHLRRSIDGPAPLPVGRGWISPSSKEFPMAAVAPRGYQGAISLGCPF